MIKCVYIRVLIRKYPSQNAIIQDFIDFTSERRESPKLKHWITNYGIGLFPANPGCWSFNHALPVAPRVP